MTKPIANNITLENFDCFEIIENIKEVDKLHKVYDAPTVYLLNGGFVVE